MKEILFNISTDKASYNSKEAQHDWKETVIYLELFKLLLAMQNMHKV